MLKLYCIKEQKKLDPEYEDHSIMLICLDRYIEKDIRDEVLKNKTVTENIPKNKHICAKKHRGMIRSWKRWSISWIESVPSETS